MYNTVVTLGYQPRLSLQAQRSANRRYQRLINSLFFVPIPFGCA
jgi:hypothetical protein